MLSCDTLLHSHRELHKLTKRKNIPGTWYRWNDWSVEWAARRKSGRVNANWSHAAVIANLTQWTCTRFTYAQLSSGMKLLLQGSVFVIGLLWLAFLGTGHLLHILGWFFATLAFGLCGWLGTWVLLRRSFAGSWLCLWRGFAAGRDVLLIIMCFLAFIRASIPLASCPIIHLHLLIFQLCFGGDYLLILPAGWLAACPVLPALFLVSQGQVPASPFPDLQRVPGCPHPGDVVQ